MRFIENLIFIGAGGFGNEHDTKIQRGRIFYSN